MPTQERVFLEMYRASPLMDQRLIQTILAGVLSGQVSLSVDEARHFAREDWETLARRLQQSCTSSLEAGETSKAATVDCGECVALISWRKC